jgi:hypothetical protein
MHSILRDLQANASSSSGGDGGGPAADADDAGRPALPSGGSWSRTLSILRQLEADGAAAAAAVNDAARDNDDGAWARTVPAGGGSRRPGNPGAVLGEWLDSAVVADEASVERPTMHPMHRKRKQLIKDLRVKERFQKPTADGLIVCTLCEWGPLGRQDVDMGDTPYLTDFDRMYRDNLGNMNWLHLYRLLRNFWNQHIATQPDEYDQLDAGSAAVPEVQICDLQHHYEKCCRTRNIERIVLEQVDNILQIQDNIMNNGLYVVAVDDQGADDMERPADGDSAKKARPLVNPKAATQWREFNRSLIYSLKAYLECRNADGQIPESVTGKKRKRQGGSSSSAGPTQKSRATFDKNY